MVVKSIQSIFEQVTAMGNTSENPNHKEFFEEIIGRCVADMAGITQSKGEGNEAAPGAVIAEMYQKIKEKHGDVETRNLILKNLSGYTKGQVHTPHPTEVFSEEAIDAEETFVKTLSELPELFSRDITTELPPEKVINLKQAMSQLNAAIKPLDRALTIDEEMRRSIRFSQRQFDGIPIITNTLLNAVQMDSSQLSYENLKQFSHLIEPETWSPGDQDSKPDMTVDMLKRGVALNHRAMMFHYYRTLTVLGSNPKITPEASAAIQHIMCRLLKAGIETPAGESEKLTPDYATDRLMGKASKAAGGLGKRFANQYEPYASQPFFTEFKRQLPELAVNGDKAYNKPEDFLKDLEMLRTKISHIKNPAHPRISAIDSLIVQAMNFKDSALRVQIRQNAEMHRKVLKYLVEKIPQEQLPEKFKQCTFALDDPDNAGAVEILLDEFLSGTNSAFVSTLKSTIETELRVITEIAQIPTRQHVTDGALTQGQFDFYQTMESFGFAAQHPNRIPRYLIAECRSNTDTLSAFFMLKAMESLRAPDAKEKVEIVNLVEHPDRVKETPNGKLPARDMIVASMQNPYFRKHHIENVTSSNHLLHDYKLQGGDRQVSVAEAKRMYGLEVREGDETKEVAGVKMMMGAGSDVTKTGGVAAAMAMADAMEKTRNALLNQDPPILLIDYIGCGGGVHRTSPIDASFRTEQGRSMRRSGENVAQEVLKLGTRHLFNRLAMNNPESGQEVPASPGFLSREFKAKDRDILCRLNMGNMASLPTNPGMWENITKQRTYAMMEEYETLYNSEEFKALMGYTSKPFVDITQYAARPAARVGSTETQKTFPPAVDVEKTRAIGYGAALNAAGICAPMFFGGSKYLAEMDTPSAVSLRQMYVLDPKAQDTINRMTYGIVMADMDTAWKYVGDTEPPAEETLKTLAATIPASDNRKETARHCLAKIHLEYNAVAQSLLKLHKSLVGQHGPVIKTGKDAASELLSTLPQALREQLEISKHNIKKPRHDLAVLFHKMEAGEIPPDAVKRSEANNRNSYYDNTIYPAMGTVYEITEHTPRAYTRPVWAKEVETNRSKTAVVA